MTPKEKLDFIERMAVAFSKLKKLNGYKGMATKSVGAFRSSALGVAKGSTKYLKSGLSKSTWIMVGFIYMAETGLNYRRYKKGRIDKAEFWNRVKMGSIETVGGLAGGVGGTAAGFALGTMILPGIGSAIGALGGGIAGGIIGANVLTKTYKMIESKIEEARELNAKKNDKNQPKVEK